MPITELQKVERKKYIGSSDMAAILGLNPYTTAYDIWLQKTGQVEEQPENESMFIGTMLEDGVLNFAESELGSLVRNIHLIHDNEIIASNVDALVLSTGEPVEAKTVGIMRGFAGDEWGDAGTDYVPDYVIVQAHVHMLCSKKDICYIPALLAGRGLLLFHVPFNKDLGDTIVESAEKFWTENVQAMIPPDALPSESFIKRVRRVPNKEVAIEADLISAYNAACDIVKAAEEKKAKTKAELLKSLGDAEKGIAADGRAVTYFEVDKKEYTVKASKYRAIKILKGK